MRVVPEPLSALAILLFGLIAGWVLRSATPGRGLRPSDGGVAPGPVEPLPEEREEDSGSDGAAPQAPEPEVREPEPQPEPPRVAAPPSPARTPDPAPPVAAPDRGDDFEAALEAYDDVLDDWLDDRGDLGADGRASLDAFEAAVARLDMGADRAQALGAAAALVREHRHQPLDADTDAALRALEARIRP